MLEKHLPKNAELHHEKFTVTTDSNIPNEQSGCGSLRVFVRIDGSPFTKPNADGKRTFLINQKIIDERWTVIPWGDGFAIAPITYKDTIAE